MCTGSESTDAVGSYAANPWGLHDMHGNVKEKCLDRWDGTPNYPAGAVVDPYVSSGSLRVARGGSWFSDSMTFGVLSECSSFYRDSDGADSTDGFRIVLAPIIP